MYDTCPTQYAPDFRGSILCRQGTQYAPRESILCMEHFVALHKQFRFCYQMKAEKRKIETPAHPLHCGDTT